jgi:hypothetical protein
LVHQSEKTRVIQGNFGKRASVGAGNNLVEGKWKKIFFYIGLNVAYFWRFSPL